MPTLYPDSITTSSADIVGAPSYPPLPSPLDADDATYIEAKRFNTGPPNRIITYWSQAEARSAVPFLRFSTSDNVEGVGTGDGYSEERWQVFAYDLSTGGDELFIRWQGGAPVNPDGSSVGLTTYDLDEWPLVSYVDTLNNGEWLTYDNGSDGAGALDDWRPGLLEQLNNGTLVMEIRRDIDGIVGRTDARIRVVEFGIVYTTASAVRQYPRDDSLGLGSATRLYPPPKRHRLAGGYQ